MLNRLAGLATCGLILASGSAAFADGMPRQTYAAPVCAPSNFAGFYLGGHAGYAIAGTNSTLHDDNDLGETLASGNHRGTTYGAQVGYNYQRCNLVLGVEADWTWMNGSARKSDAEPDSVSSQVRDLGSARGRAGIVVDNMLFYATAGYGWGRANYSFVDADAGTVRVRLSEQGLVYGAGAEFQLHPSILLRAEYLHYSFGKDVFVADAIPTGPSSIAYRLSDVDTIRVGLSFKLDREVRAVPLK